MFFSFWTVPNIFTSAILLRIGLLIFGILQDQYAPLPYTDIDYFVFTDAARYVSRGLSPYERETYRYTPLLAWLLIPTAWPGPLWFAFGKILFAAADIVVGWLTLLVLQSPSDGGGGMGSTRALKYASIWLLNPMVATISTRGSSEGLLGVMVVALLWAVLTRRIALAGALLGLAVHFKIYPFIYGISILWYLDDDEPAVLTKKGPNTVPTALIDQAVRFFNESRLVLLTSSLFTFAALNGIMFYLHGTPFLQHTYLHHLTRIDHRHNFSPYNTLLHLASTQSAAAAASSSTSTSGSEIISISMGIERLAFLPQLLLSAIFIPLILAKRSLPGAMLVQTFAFVTFNKVCTSQYFLWYLVLLPFYLPYSSLVHHHPHLGFTVAGAWVGSQGLWLYLGWRLEFLGESTFVPGLWLAGLLFFGVNCWILGIMVRDVGCREESRQGSSRVMVTSKD